MDVSKPLPANRSEKKGYRKKKKLSKKRGNEVWEREEPIVVWARRRKKGKAGT